jgi:hypothetical protein
MIDEGELAGRPALSGSRLGGNVKAGLLQLSHDTFSGGLAGLIAGLLVLGLGSRLIMRISALLSPESKGILTDNGNIVGEITLGGTLELVIFVGLFGGLLSGTLWVLMRDWLPADPGRRIATAALLAAMVGSSAAVQTDNKDFHELAAPAANIAMFVALMGLTGATTAALDPILSRSLPSGPVAGVIFGLLAGSVGLIMLAFVVQVFFLNPEEGMSSYAGPFVILAAVATFIGWKRYFTSEEPPAGWGPLRVMAVVGIAGAAVAGLADLAVEVGAIL